MIINTLPTVVDLALKDQGLIYTFQDYCAGEIERGDLVPVLEKHIGEAPGIYIYFPREYRTMMPLRLFREHLVEI